MSLSFSPGLAQDSSWYLAHDFRKGVVDWDPDGALDLVLDLDYNSSLDVGPDVPIDCILDLTFD